MAEGNVRWPGPDPLRVTVARQALASAGRADLAARVESNRAGNPMMLDGASLSPVDRVMAHAAFVLGHRSDPEGVPVLCALDPVAKEYVAEHPDSFGFISPCTDCANRSRPCALSGAAFLSTFEDSQREFWSRGFEISKHAAPPRLVDPESPLPSPDTTVEPAAPGIPGRGSMRDRAMAADPETGQQSSAPL